ncbi:ATP-binding cassette domain-containing protein [Belnapia sp. T6]|uniref:ATP-binding cassette domain-containing protein n=1 Tax=Belnapia mucosa TaxID=2804532 RepID=A0ABS1V4T2_9PROT|nr:ATP-binding cassette domain-containing protein [Belnapia mucosa]MBL6456705.1 ATP-binding cassette domain-containing protein [Belnapia mucosa]
MAQAPTDGSPNALLREAIEEVKKTAFTMLRSLAVLLVLSILLGYAILFAFRSLSRSIPYTHSHDSLISGVAIWLILLVTAVIIEQFKGIIIRQLSSYVTRRMSVPAVLALAQRAGRPESTAGAALTDLETVRSSLNEFTVRALIGIATVPFMLAFVPFIHWVCLLLAVFFCSLAGLLSMALARATRKEGALASDGVSQAYGLAADAMRSGEAILAMGILPRLAQSWIGISTQAAGDAWRARLLAARLRLALDIVLEAFRGSIMFTLVFLTFAGANVAGMFAVATFLVFRLIQPFGTIGIVMQNLGEARAAWNRLNSILSDTPLPPEGIAFPCPQGRLVVEHMSFTFRGPQPVLLRNIDLTLEPGTVLAVVGASGSGKSTLLRVLLGLHRPAMGGVYLDGHSTSQWDRRDFARHVGFLPQQPLLSRGTVAEVIARLDEPDMALVVEAARRAGAHEIIVGLPFGYATTVSGNYQLSMGQRHRIAIARALYGRPKLLLLDELAGSLDKEGEAQIAALLHDLKREGVSVVFTTHRPGLIAAADRVMALRNGTLVPTGEDSLMLSGPGRRALPSKPPALTRKAEAA